MVQITIDDNLANAIAQAGHVVTLVDSHGKPVALTTPMSVEPKAPHETTPEDLAEIERRMKEDDGTRFTWAQVKDHLNSLTSK